MFGEIRKCNLIMFARHHSAFHCAITADANLMLDCVLTPSRGIVLVTLSIKPASSTLAGCSRRSFESWKALRAV